MLPIGDDDSGRRTFPIVTYGLIALNILFFFVELAGGEQPQHEPDADALAGRAAIHRDLVGDDRSLPVSLEICNNHSWSQAL